MWKEELTRDIDVSSKPEKVELKALPSTLKYAYLDEGHEKPVILSSSLSFRGRESAESFKR